MEATGTEQFFSTSNALKEQGFAQMEFRWKIESSDDGSRLYLRCPCDKTFLALSLDGEAKWTWDYVGSFLIYGLEVSGKCLGKKCDGQTISLRTEDIRTVFFPKRYSEGYDTVRVWGDRIVEAMQAYADTMGGALTFEEHCRHTRGKVSKKALLMFLQSEVLPLCYSRNTPVATENPEQWKASITRERDFVAALHSFFWENGLFPQTDTLKIFCREILDSPLGMTPARELLPIVLKAICEKLLKIRQSLRQTS